MRGSRVGSFSQHHNTAERPLLNRVLIVDDVDEGRRRRLRHAT